MNELFERLEPPADGLRTLRYKLDAGDAPRREWRVSRRVASGFAAVLALTVLGIGYLVFPDRIPPPSGDYGIFQAYMSSTPEHVRLPGGEEVGLRLTQQPTANAKVRLYWIDEIDADGEA